MVRSTLPLALTALLAWSGTKAAAQTSDNLAKRLSDVVVGVMVGRDLPAVIKQAEGLVREARALGAEACPTEVGAQQAIGEAQDKLGDTERAIAAYDAGASAARSCATLPPDKVGRISMLAGQTFYRAKRYRDAANRFETALQLYRRAPGQEANQVRVGQQLGLSANDAGDYERALTAWRESWPLVERLVKKGQEPRADTAGWIARLAVKVEPGNSEALLLRAIGELEAEMGPNHPTSTDLHDALVTLLEKQERRREAAKWRAKLVAACRAFAASRELAIMLAKSVPQFTTPCHRAGVAIPR